MMLVTERRKKEEEGKEEGIKEGRKKLDEKQHAPNESMIEVKADPIDMIEG
jgi:hypothetical protein